MMLRDDDFRMRLDTNALLTALQTDCLGFKAKYIDEFLSYIPSLQSPLGL
jgi:hypothetical protein